MNTIFEFNKNADIKDWTIVNDGVMGGKSAGSFSLSADGFGMFHGEVSLENNGGFSSVQYKFEAVEVKDAQAIVLKIKGDGKAFQIRIKDNLNHSHSYVTSFKTSGEWEEIRITLKDMYPKFRGRLLDLPHFASKHIEQVSFLIGNKKAENFKLLINKIELH